VPGPDARVRILRAATKLLATGGRTAVTTRAVCAAAGVQPPTIYQYFGDMQGLFDEVARETIAFHVREQTERTLTNDPVEDLRQGWNLHIAFGLAHPDGSRCPTVRRASLRPDQRYTKELQCSTALSPASLRPSGSVSTFLSQLN
jgi:AcrR family transcriptional regulator